MNLIQFSLRNPVTVVVGIIIVMMFGAISLQDIPIQLSPSVEEPVISVATIWPGATPYEIERDIIEEQEKVLKGVPGLYEMESTSSNNRGQVTLRFKIGTDIDNALLRVSNKLNEVPSYPENVQKPVLNASGAESSPVMWMMLRTTDDNPRTAYTYRTYVENEVRQYLDRVEGVADLFIGGGVEREMHVLVDPARLASYELTVNAVINALRYSNANISAGNLGVGRRDYRVRTVAEYRSEDDIREVVVVSDGEREVTVGDLATVSFGYDKLTTPVIVGGRPGIAIGVRPEPNANVLDLTDRIEAVMEELNAGKLKDADVYLDLVNEQRPYIRGAIELLRQNILLGGALAVTVLLVFLQHFAPTIVVSTAIPISIVGTFTVMRAMGSTLNIVSLAGIAFAVGMLVDNAIVVLENIDRHRRMGKTPEEAAYDGAREVWGAVLASSLTTIAVFLPVVFLADEAGQLFKDIAIAVSSAVALSLVVSMTVIPMLSQKLFSWETRRAERKAKATGKFRGDHTQRPGVFDGVGRVLRAGFMALIGLVLRNAVTRLVTVAVLAGGAILCAYTLFPKMEYLPQGNRDLIINVLIPPPGLSYEERKEIGDALYDQLEPYFDPEFEGGPGIEHVFYVGIQQNMILGVVSADQERTRELLPICQGLVSSVPGVFGISNQAGIFQQGLGKGRTIDVDLSGSDINEIVSVAGMLFGMVKEEIPGVQVRPVPSLDLLFPESNFVPDRERLRSVGMTAREFGVALDVLMDGRDIGDFKQEGQKKIDLVVKVADQDMATPEALHDALIVTPVGTAVPVSSLADMQQEFGLTEIRHLERNRTVSLQVTPPVDVTIQEAMERIRNDLAPQLKQRGMLKNVTLTMSGTADKLTETRRALQFNFLLAAAITYLLMAALFGNFVYPLIIMFTVPLAGAGGLLGLRAVSTLIEPQQLDILTMLGFIILIGVVVNNAILIVYQALNNVREEGMEYKEAVLESVRTRLRPIYMSATTSILGMSPLVLWPGPGSELYRGLGSVVLGGLALSTVFTVFIIPPLLMLCIRMEKRPDTAKPATEEDAPTP
ncbi:MAG: efflux RND transporter permease subunit [bacterium]|nr:efflux RND transporter permease subunit [bacterium]